MIWFVVINKMSACQDTEGRVLSVHKSLRAALRAERRHQPREPGSYLPTTVHATPLQPRKGSLYQRCESRDDLVSDLDWQTAHEDMQIERWRRGLAK